VKVLFIGGTGEISTACVWRSVEAGHDVAMFNRGRRAEELPGQVRRIVGEMADDPGNRPDLGGRHLFAHG